MRSMRAWFIRAKREGSPAFPDGLGQCALNLCRDKHSQKKSENESRDLEHRVPGRRTFLLMKRRLEANNVGGSVNNVFG